MSISIPLKTTMNSCSNLMPQNEQQRGRASISPRTRRTPLGPLAASAVLLFLFLSFTPEKGLRWSVSSSSVAFVGAAPLSSRAEAESSRGLAGSLSPDTGLATDADAVLGSQIDDLAETHETSPELENDANEHSSKEPRTSATLAAHLLSRRACVSNKAAKNKRLCDSALAPTSFIEIGSANGLFAFLWNDGNPRIVSASASGTAVTTRWSLLRTPLTSSAGCSTFATQFLATSGEMRLNCGSTSWLRVWVNNAGRRAALVNITNTGDVRFYAANRALLLTITPTSIPAFYPAGASPSAVLNIVRRSVTTSRTRTRTTSSKSRTTSSKSRTATRITSATTPTASRTATSTSKTASKTALGALTFRATSTSATLSRTSSTVSPTSSTSSGTVTSTSVTVSRTSSTTVSRTSSTSSETVTPTSSLSATTSTTVTPSTTTTFTTTTITYPHTITPSLNPSNTILLSTCSYVPVPFTVPDASQNQSTVFNIELINCSGDSTYDSVFIGAAQKWMSLITADIYDRVAGWNCGYQFDGTASLYCGYVDDVVITYRVVPIDGVGYVLGGASPYFTRPNTIPNAGLPYSGTMEFDSADWAWMASQGYLEAVIMHEMGHILGIGSLWSNFGIMNPSDCSSYDPPVNPKFTGAYGNSSLVLVDPDNYRNLVSQRAGRDSVGPEAWKVAGQAVEAVIEARKCGEGTTGIPRRRTAEAQRRDK